MRKKFVFATNNSHKLEEVTAILGEKVELLRSSPPRSKETRYISP